MIATGFASYLEDILDRLEIFYLPVPQAGGKGSGGNNRTDVTEISQSDDEGPSRPPWEFREKVSQLLLRDSVPHYIVENYVNYIYWYMKGEMSMDQVFGRFGGDCIPLLTEHLLTYDAATIRFVGKLMQKPPKRNRSK